MSTHDLAGREYARLAGLKSGDVVELDGGFTCAKAGPVTLQAYYDGELFFTCREGAHGLAGQLDHDSDHLIGIYGPIRRQPEAQP